jgi:hypothetical protein
MHCGGKWCCVIEEKIGSVALAEIHVFFHIFSLFNLLFFHIFPIEKILKIWKKSKLNSEKIRKIQKKSKLNSEKIGKIWKKGKSNSEKI